MKRNTWILGIIAFVIIVGGVYASIRGKNDAVKEKKMDDSVIIQKEDNRLMKDDTVKENEVLKGSYEAYAPEKLARAETGDVVLFFHASWCPSCRSLNLDIENNMSLIPEDVSILKVDYDQETALKKKYGVTTQHTLVQVDADGSLIKKWIGSPKLASLLSEIN